MVITLFEEAYYLLSSSLLIMSSLLSTQLSTFSIHMGDYDKYVKNAN